MSDAAVNPLAPFLLPDGFEPPPLKAVLRERSVVREAGRYAVRTLEERRLRAPVDDAPVLLVPGFMAGDTSLAPMAKALRRRGWRTYRSHIHANVGCTREAAERLEARLEAITEKRGVRAQVVGHSLGGMIARGLAVRRPDLVAGIVTLGSPMLAPAAHHAALSLSVEVLVRLSWAGVPGLMTRRCVAGSCARESFDESREPVPTGVGFTAVYSRRDGIVDWRACVDAAAVPVEVGVSHVGMAVDPRVIDEVAAALRRQADAGDVGRVVA
ncbi:alpha/beta fold hydrolase [Nocardioides marinquilinus]|uniref:alpha/beta fold hydrolase n=1 Tax=Nocardioides marinquilinus TaxID=1210400 RepID=UPI0031F0A088